MRILIIEDEAALRQQVIERLGAEGYTVDASGNGKEGLFLASEYPLDLAIIDLGLPGMVKRDHTEHHEFGPIRRLGQSPSALSLEQGR